MYNCLNCNATQLREILHLGYRTQIPVYIVGPPGIGKSEIVHQFAQEINARMPNPLILSSVQPEDIRGVGIPDPTTDRLKYYQLGFFPPSDSRERWVLFYDELSNADKRLQAPIQQLILHRQAGDYTLPQDCYQVAAGNTVDDECFAYSLSRALEDRFMIVRLSVCVKSWIDWALKAGVSTEIVTFLKVRPEYLHYTLMREKFEDTEDNRILPTPRAWGKYADRVLKDPNSPRSIKEIALSGLVGANIAALFYRTVDELANVIDPETLLKMSTTEALKNTPESLAGVWSLAFSLLAYCQKEEHFSKAAVYLSKLRDLDDKRPLGEIVTLVGEKLMNKARVECKIPIHKLIKIFDPLSSQFDPKVLQALRHNV